MGLGFFVFLSEIWREVVQTLQSKAEVDPGFTPLVWQKLQERNQDLFQASAMRLQLTDQINLSLQPPLSPSLSRTQHETIT